MTDSEDDAIWGNPSYPQYSNSESKYPVHDCCEMHGAEQLKALIYVRQYSSDDDSSSDSNNEENTKRGQPEGDETKGNADDTMNSGENSKQKSLKEPRYYCPYDLNERDDDQNTPLHVAIHSMKLDCVKLLIDSGVSVNRRCDGSTPLHLAISLGAIAVNEAFSVSCVKLLIEEGGADLFIRDESSQSPLLLATKLTLIPIVDYILNKTEQGPLTLEKCDRLGNRPITAISSQTPHSLTTLLLTQTAKLSAATSVMDNEQTDNESKAVPVYKHSKNGQGRTALHQALACGNWDVARVLLNNDDYVEAQHQAVMEVEEKRQIKTANIVNESVDVEMKTTEEKEQSPSIKIKLKDQKVRLKDCVDKRGFTPLELCLRRGFAPPADLMALLKGESDEFNEIQGHRDMILDPPGETLASTHGVCLQHHTCAPIRRGGSDPPPENVRRLNVLLNTDVGILRSNEFKTLHWNNNPPRANIADVLRVHSYSYIDRISTVCTSLPDNPSCVTNLDADTAISRHSFEAAMRASGAVIEAVDKVMSGDFRNAFLPLRPPGHHAGPDGIVTCANDPDGSHGFCLVNHVAIAAAYFRATYKSRVAILDFDVHHGNGTEACISRALLPRVNKHAMSFPAPFSTTATITKTTYSPWLNEHDAEEVFFASTHGYGAREDCAFGVSQGWFYPASGESYVSTSLNISDETKPTVEDFLQSQTWARIPEEQRRNCCKIINCGLSRKEEFGAECNAMQRLELRESYRSKILPALIKFNPDLILVSAGFDAHRKDDMNQGYVGMVEDDYEWLTQQIVKVANVCCQGRVISVLEGGYKVHGGVVSPFARSVAAHVRALVDGGSSREMWSDDDAKWESEFEKALMNEKLRKRDHRTTRSQRVNQDQNRINRNKDQIADQISHEAVERTSEITKEPQATDTDNDKLPSVTHSNIDALFHEPLNENESHNHDPDGSLLDNTEPPVESGDDALPRKRRRPQVDYKQLYEKMKKEESVNRTTD